MEKKCEIQSWEFSNSSWEFKKFYKENDLTQADMMLKNSLLVDPNYPQNIIHSIYYSSPFFNERMDKLESTINKDKYRLRFYEGEKGIEQSFYEKKSTLSGGRAKKRSIFVDGNKFFERNKDLPLDLWNTDDNFMFKGFTPLIYLKYKRQRFVDIANNSRINLDTDIELVRAASSLGGIDKVFKISGGVLELKSNTKDTAKESMKKLNINLNDSFSKLVFLSQIYIKKRNWNSYESIDELLSSDGI